MPKTIYNTVLDLKEHKNDEFDFVYFVRYIFGFLPLRIPNAVQDS